MAPQISNVRTFAIRKFIIDGMVGISAQTRRIHAWSDRNSQEIEEITELWTGGRREWKFDARAGGIDRNPNPNKAYTGRGPKMFGGDLIADFRLFRTVGRRKMKLVAARGQQNIEGIDQVNCLQHAAKTIAKNTWRPDSPTSNSSYASFLI